MIHGEGLTVRVCGEQRLWMAGRRQVERHKVRVRIPEASRLTEDSTRVNFACDIGG